VVYRSDIIILSVLGEALPKSTTNIRLSELALWYCSYST